MRPARILTPWPPRWWGQARCAGKKTPATSTFFPSEGDVRPAKAWCSGCPVRVECLDCGLEEPHGVWGGLDGRDRRRLVKVRAQLRRGEPGRVVGPTIAKLMSAGLDAAQAQTVLGLDPDDVAELCGACPARSDQEAVPA